MTYVIRKMELGDLRQVIAIDQSSFSLPWPEKSFFFELRGNPAARCWVADLDRKIIGMLVAWMIVDEYHIATLATHPDFRRRGVGKKLLAHALQSAKEEGATYSCLEARAGNIAALEMYRQFGFEEDARRKNYYKDNNEDAVLMTLRGLTFNAQRSTLNVKRSEE